MCDQPHAHKTNMPYITHASWLILLDTDVWNLERLPCRSCFPQSGARAIMYRTPANKRSSVPWTHLAPFNMIQLDHKSHISVVFSTELGAYVQMLRPWGKRLSQVGQESPGEILAEAKRLGHCNASKIWPVAPLLAVWFGRVVAQLLSLKIRPNR